MSYVIIFAFIIAEVKLDAVLQLEEAIKLSMTGVIITRAPVL